MELQNLRGFLAVARYGSFTEAAYRTRRTQPTVSLQVKALEDELSVELFERLSPKNIRLTSEGQLLAKLAAPLVEQFENLEAKFNEARHRYHQTTVTIVTHRAIMVSILPGVIKAFRKKFPNVQLSILNRRRREMLELLSEGDADFAITSFDKVPSQIEYHCLARYNRILIGHKSHPLAEKKQVTLADIASHPLILPHPDSNTRRMIDGIFSQVGLQYQLAMEVVGRDAIKTYVGMNFGLSILNEYYVSTEERKKLFVRDLSKFIEKAETGIAFRRGRQLSAPAEELMNLCSESIKHGD